MEEVKKEITILILMIGMAQSGQAATMVISSDLGFGISGKNNNFFAFDFTTFPVWTAGAQRSDNGGVDPANRRAGRVFVEFMVTQALIDEASIPGASVSLTFHVDSIGSGVAGTPYTDGLDVRYLGIGADRTVAVLWNTAAIGADEADVLPTTGPTGSSTTGLTSPTLVDDIANATAGQFIAFALLNTSGVTADPVGNSVAETYGFQINKTEANHILTITSVPEPSSVFLLVMSSLAAFRRKRS